MIRAQKSQLWWNLAEPEPVFRRLEALQVDLVAIFNTHHHGDHVGANQALINRYPHLRVYGERRIAVAFYGQAGVFRGGG
jgi:hydroxyacylglutathione hydrolase